MLRFLALLFLLVPSTAKSQEMTKENMITEFSDIATLIAAQTLGCGETDQKRVLAFNAIFDSFMLYTAEQEGYDITQQDVDDFKLSVLISQYEAMAEVFPRQGCHSLNSTIESFDSTLTFADSVYDYYTPLDNI